jgi:hypothetical protein
MAPTLPNTTYASRRELAQRSANGIEVMLYWKPIHDSSSGFAPLRAKAAQR